ncbi:NDR1/HIN1-like protein 13 [Cannabis sativa]|uniref:NDR1/HIN1-like protein 13 n=1 Tax=Cannabis sativa TaxID=3483 RepID=UPI0029CA9392|nr:NDR1/HIN1-like protein 13 [Cannabis sativa]
MEGRVPPSSAAAADNIEESSGANNELDPSSEPPLPRLPETYVIQIPKDQIYRVPPPENARTAELRLRKPLNNSKARKSTNRACLFLLCIVITLLVVGLVIGLTLLVMFCSLSLKPPKFSVENVHLLNQSENSTNDFINSSSSNNNNNNLQSYAVYVKVDNINSNTGISYQQEGSVTSLTFRDKNIGKGTYPSMFQTGDFNSTTVRLVLDGSKGVFMHEEKLREQDFNKDKLPIALSLKLDIPIRMYVWILEIWKKEIFVGCKIKLTGWNSKNSKVIQGACHTKFRS